MRIYLMQHGACLPKELDPDQALSPVGREQVEKSACMVKNLGLWFDAIFASTKLRSMQSAEIMAKAINFPIKKIISSDLLKPMGEPKKALDQVLDHDNQETILIAGHLPSLNNIASLLLLKDQPPTLHFGFENAGLMCITVESSHRRGTLDWYLPQKFIGLMQRD